MAETNFFFSPYACDAFLLSAAKPPRYDDLWTVAIESKRTQGAAAAGAGL
ncbi:hypothetical protein [Lacipirellula limnantheis]|nr:hypothetical protein [Lacipirellula limnantheis]